MNCSNKKVLLTGATGLIGKEAIEPLLALGYQVFAVSREDRVSNLKGLVWLTCDLFDDAKIEELMHSIKPTHLLHFAWCTTDDYLTSNLNLDYVQSSISLLKYFYKNGGKRVVFAGTCFEFDFKQEILHDNAMVNPQILYSKSKNALRLFAEAFCEQNNIKFGWGRIFYVYGHNEHPKRLTASIINSLKTDKPVTISYGQLVRDYMYTKDIAEAFACFLDSSVCGCVNISTGAGISLKDYALKIGQKLNKINLIHIKNEETAQPLKIIGDNKRLTREVNYTCQYSFSASLDAILN